MARPSGPSLRRIAGIAGLAYVAGAAIENMEILDAPALGARAADIRAYYADTALAVVTTLAGALALIAYCVFVVALVRLLRDDEPAGDRWSVAALVGGIGGPALAAVGLGASTALANGTGGMSDGAVVDTFDFYLTTRIASGAFVALFLLGVGVAALRSGALPAPLAWAACALAAPMSLAPAAAIVTADWLEVAVRVAFGGQSLWILATSMWLVLADGSPAARFVRRCAFLLLAVAAGLIGIALVAVPAATAEFFAWPLGPEPLAAFAGGVYVGSAAAYAASLPASERIARGLVAGAVVLSVSVLAITLAHLDQFDFDRLQAWAWVVLFAGFSLVTGAIFLMARGAAPAADAPAESLAPGVRVALGAVAVVLGCLATALWIDPEGVAGAGPFDAAPLGGRFAGSWIALLAVLAGWAAVRNRRDEARPSALGLVALPAGALVAALRTIGDLEPAGTAAAYLAALVALLATGAVTLAAVGGTDPGSNGRLESH